jgi:transposase
VGVPTAGPLRQDRARRGDAHGASRGRRRENLTREEEAAFLAPFLQQARAGGVLVVPPVKLALEERLGRLVALSSVYRVLHRHDWRKLAPDKRHPEADVVAQEEWKKTVRGARRNRRAVRRPGAGPGDVPGRSAL